MLVRVVVGNLSVSVALARLTLPLFMLVTRHTIWPPGATLAGPYLATADLTTGVAVVTVPVAETSAVAPSL
ncbi:MAG: hypothetical protein BWY91_01236 [bacterium ADurb.BinA028]|nr:MAG: hypothetical protein BWY91_01236 [bacterium ADurb.BinA028]